MNIVFLSTEAVPFAKTGGLGDVCGSLPATLAESGDHVCMIMPAFSVIRDAGVAIESTDMSVSVEIGGRVVSARLLKSKLPGSRVDVYFIDQPQYYGRAGLYGDRNGDHPDNCERFAFFCRAALQVIQRVCPDVDIVHCNDWQTGLIPAFMAFQSHLFPWMERARSVMTVHNLAYQGRFWHYDMPLTGLGWEHFTPDGVEFYGDINFLKTGILLADMITTVSPTYAKEIQTSQHGCGFESILRARSTRIRGITNGIDDEIWNPATDPHLTQNYDIDSWLSGKTANKNSLQSEFGLEVNPSVPLVGLVGRLADQKGWDFVIEVMRWNLEENRPVQWMVLGTGELRYHDALSAFASRFPDRFGLKLGFSDALAHRIEAGSDLFLMPSRYEPCGLNQLYSLRYGSVPVVMATGGLVDTVIDVNEQTLASQTATGFHINEFSAPAVDAALGKALSMRHHRVGAWAAIVNSGMATDSSWRKSAMRYQEVYAEVKSLDD